MDILDFLEFLRTFFKDFLYYIVQFKFFRL